MLKRFMNWKSQKGLALPTSRVLLALTFLTVAGVSSAEAQTVNCASSTQGPLPKSMRKDVKFFSGSYIYISSPWGSDLLPGTLTEVGGLPTVKGLMKKYFWSELEPTKDNYSGIAKIKNDLDRVAAKGKKLAVMITYKFKAPNPDYQNPMPNYLKEMTGNDYYLPIGGKDGQGEFASGYIAKFSNPIVVQRYIKLLSQLKALDSHPALAAVVFPETANGVRPELINMTTHYAGMMLTDRAAACYFLQTPVIQLTNYPTKLNILDDVLVPTYKQYGIGYGGPDVFLHEPELNNGAYSYHPSLNGQLPIGMVVAGQSNFKYDNHEDWVNRVPNGLTVPDAVNQVYRFATDNLSSNFIFWRKERRDDPYYVQLLKKLSAESAPATVPTCPSLFESCRK